MACERHLSYICIYIHVYVFTLICNKNCTYYNNKLSQLHFKAISIGCCLWDHTEGLYNIIYAALKITTRAWEQKVQPSRRGNACSSQCQCAFWSLLSTTVLPALGWRTTTNHNHKCKQQDCAKIKWRHNQEMFVTFQKYFKHSNILCLSIGSSDSEESSRKQHLLWLVTCPWWTPAFLPEEDWDRLQHAPVILNRNEWV